MSEYIVRESGYPGTIKQETVQELVRCKDCKYRIVNEHYGEKGYLRIKAMCELESDIFELGRRADEDDWYCADGERREGEGG